jgi:hypothetical protein
MSTHTSFSVPGASGAQALMRETKLRAELLNPVPKISKKAEKARKD